MSYLLFALIVIKTILNFIKLIKNEIFFQMNKQMSGHSHSIVQRDRKTGRRRDFEREAAEEKEKNKEQEEINAKYAVWGKG